MRNRLRNERKLKNLTQQDIANALQTTRQHYACYENGSVEMPAYQLRNICQVLNVSADYLLGLSNTKERQ